jgi:hypothetical protein
VRVRVGVGVSVRVLVDVRVLVTVGAVRETVPLTTQTPSNVSVIVKVPFSPRLEGTPPKIPRQRLVAPAGTLIGVAGLALVGGVESFPP